MSDGPHGQVPPSTTPAAQVYAPPQPGYGPPTPGFGPAGGGFPPAPGGYGSPAPLHGSAQSQAKGFLGSLFDFGFTSFVTPIIIRVLYVLVAVLIALSYLGAVVTSFAASPGAGVFIFLFGAVFAVFTLALARIALEFYMAFFRMSDDVQQLKNQRSL